MRYTLDNGKIVTIPDKEIDNYVNSLNLTIEEAVNLWLEDNDYQVNEEQKELDEKAKNAKGCREMIKAVSAKSDRAPRTVHTSDEKKALFDSILANLDRCEGVTRGNIAILRENKLIQVDIGGKTFKIDIIEQRPKK